MPASCFRCDGHKPGGKSAYGALQNSGCLTLRRTSPFGPAQLSHPSTPGTQPCITRSSPSASDAEDSDQPTSAAEVAGVVPQHREHAVKPGSLRQPLSGNSASLADDDCDVAALPHPGSRHTQDSGRPCLGQAATARRWYQFTVSYGAAYAVPVMHFTACRAGAQTRRSSYHGETELF